MKSVKKQLQNDDDRSFEVDIAIDLTREFIITKLRGEIWQFSNQVMHIIDYAIKNKVLKLIKDGSKEMKSLHTKIKNRLIYSYIDYILDPIFSQKIMNNLKNEKS
jgi:hypothetical protein